MNSTAAALARARQLIALRRWEAALQALAPVHGNQDLAAEALRLRAQCLIGFGKPVEAVVAARESLAVEPDSAWGHRLLALGQLRSSRPRAALAAAREAMRLEPESVYGLHLLAIAHLARRQLPEATQVARSCLSTYPNAPLAHYTAAKVAERSHRDAEAERHYRNGLRLSPNDPDLTLALAQFLHRKGRADEAAQAYLAAGRSNPTDKRVRHGLARLGLPAAGAVALGLKFLPAIGLANLLHGYSTSQPTATRMPSNSAAVSAGAIPALLVAAVIIGFVLGILAATRVMRLRRAARALPAEVRLGLRGDHRNIALGWLQWIAVSWALLGLLALVLPSPGGGGLVIAGVLIAMAAIACGLVRWLWVGPRPGWAALRARLGRIGRQVGDAARPVR